MQRSHCNLVNKANLLHNLYLVYLSISTCFWVLCAHHQEKKLCLWDTCYLLFCVDDCRVCRVEWVIPPSLYDLVNKANLVIPPSLYDLVNKANLVRNLFLVYLFLVYLSISTCFGLLCAHHQEKQLCLCDTCYLLFRVDDCLVCRVEWITPPCIPDSHPHRITSTKCCINTVVSPDDGHIVARNM